MSRIFVVGGHGYVGTRIAAAAREASGLTHAISRNGGTRFGLPSTSWPDFLAALPDYEDARVIWLLDGANDDEPERLSELLAAAHPDAAVVAVSTCTVYGNRGHALCTEEFERQVITVPDLDHWRGWLHRDQAARALYRAAATRSSGVFNVTTANLTFSQAVEVAAEQTGAEVCADSAPDPLSYRVDSSAAVAAGLLDELPGESIAEATAAYLRATQ